MRIPFVGEPAGQTDSKEQVGWLEELYKTADEMRKKFESEWWSNALFLAGNQWESAAQDVRRFRKIPVPAPSTKVKMVSNFTYSLARQAAAAQRDSIARQIAVPATSDEDDVIAAEIGTDFLDSRLDEDEEPELRFQEILWCMVCGRVLRKTFWDPELDAVGFGGEPIRGVGDISTMMLNPLQFHLDPWAKNWKEVQFIIESDVRDVAEINELFPGHEVKPEEYSDVTHHLDNMLSNVVGATHSGAPRRKNGAILKRLYARPSSKYPRGRVLIWAHGELLQEGALPEGELPFVPIDWFFIPGRLYPLPFITPLRDPQREYNITISQLIELKNRQLRGDIALEGQGEITQEVDPESGAKRIRIPPQSNFQFVKYDLRAEEGERLLARFWNDAMEAAGIRESSLGKMPPRETPAAMMVLLKESDAQGLTVFRKGFDVSHCKIARQKLILARNHYKVPRMLRVVGDNRAVKAGVFFGADLRNTEDVRPKSMPYLTEAQQVQVRQEAISAGLYGPYMGPKDKLAKLTALLNTNLPGIEDEVQEILGEAMTIQDLRRHVAMIDAEEAQLALIAVKAQKVGVVANVEQLMGQGQQEAGGPPAPPQAAGMGA